MRINLFYYKYPYFVNQNVAIPLKITLDQCGLIINDIGITYQGDHIQSNGEIAHSALDHVYSSSSLEKKISISKLSNGSSDHNPVVTTLKNHFNTNNHCKGLLNLFCDTI